MFIRDLMEKRDYESVYRMVREGETEAKGILIDFENKYPDTVKTENAESILRMLKAKKK